MITLTITGDTAALVLNDLAHLTNGFLVGAGQVQEQTQRDPVMPELREPPAGSPVVIGDGPHELSADQADKPRRTRRTREQIAADEAAAKAAEGNSTGGNAGPAEPEPNADSSESSSASGASTSPSDEIVELLDFDKDVAPVVLGLVKSRGKPWVVNVLSEFGVERASELDAARWPELIATLADRDAA